LPKIDGNARVCAPLKQKRFNLVTVTISDKIKYFTAKSLTR